MLRKLIGVVLLLIIFGGMIPAVGARETIEQPLSRLAITNQCLDDSMCNRGNICFADHDTGERLCRPGCRRIGGIDARCPTDRQYCHPNPSGDPLIGVCSPSSDPGSVVPPSPVGPPRAIFNPGDACANPLSVINNLTQFTIHNLLYLGAFALLDVAVSFAENVPWIGGAMEPLNQVVNFLRNLWMNTLIWGLIASVANFFAGMFMTLAIELNLSLGDNNPLILNGGQLILQLTNLGFVISIIVIGIATILRINKDAYSADKLLIKLVAGVILVNLTIPIALGITNIGTRLTEAMFKSSPCPGNLTTQFMSPMLYDRFRRILATPQLDDEGAQLDQATDEEVAGAPRRDREARAQAREEGERNRARGPFTILIHNFIALILSGALSTIAAITFLILVIFLFIRYVILMLLITFSPLIWLGYIFKELKIPGLGNPWTAWWEQFLNWTLFGPIIVLFISFTATYLHHSLPDTIVIEPASTTMPGTRSAPIASRELFGMTLPANNLSINNMDSDYTNNVISESLIPRIASAPNSPGITERVGNWVLNRFLSVLMPIAHLISVVIISAAGIFVASKFSGAGSNLIMAAATGGVGIVAGAVQKQARKRQMGAQMEYDKLKNAGQGDSLAARRLKVQANMLGSINMGTSAKQMTGGVIKPKNPNLDTFSPKPKVANEKDMRQAIIKSRLAKKTIDTADVLALSNEDINELSDRDKTKVISATRTARTEHNSKINTLNNKQLLSLSKIEKQLAPEAVNEIMNDIATPTKLSEAKKMLNLLKVQAAHLVQNGTEDQIQKSIESILSLENDMRAGGTYTPIEIAKIRELRQSFDAKITNHIVDSLDPSTNPASILNFEAINLQSMAQNASQADKQKVQDAISELVRNRSTLSPIEAGRLDYLEAKLSALRHKNEW